MAVAALEVGVWETTQSTGTSAVELVAKTGKRRFGDAYDSGTAEIPYTIEWVGGFEHGLGTYTLAGSTHQLARNTVLTRYDNDVGFVGLPEGEKQVYVGVPGSVMVMTARPQTFTEHQTMALAKRLYFGDDTDSYISSDSDDIFLFVALAQELLRLDGVNARARLISTDAAPTDGPELRISRARAAPADGNQLGFLSFAFLNDAATEAYAAKIRALAADVTGGTEDGILILEVTVASTSTEVARLTSAGVTVPTAMNIFGGGKTVSDQTAVGFELRSTGVVCANASGTAPGIFNRLTNDGTIISLRQDNIEDGTISSSTGTISYNTFLASHWSEWASGHKPITDPPLGTVLETVDEVCDWKEYLPKVRIAQPGSRRIYGVFAGYNERNRIMVHAIGAGPLVRFKGPVAGGDLLTISDEPGIACAQADDVVRRSTLGWAPVGDTLARDGLLPIVHMAG
jgi:hypothetical protein